MVPVVTALLGRNADLDAVGRFLVDPAAEDRALLLTGPAGIGRTALLDAVLREVVPAAAAGALVLRAVGAAPESDLPFAGLSQVLAPVVGATGRLDPHHRAVLAAALGGARHPPDGADLVVAVTALLHAAAGERLVVVGVDDLPALDAASAGCLLALARPPSLPRLRLLATSRAGGTDLPERRLRPLDDRAAAAVLAARAPGLRRADRDRVLRAAHGNPLVLHETPLRAGDVLGPGLTQLFSGRISALPAPVRRLLLRAALADPADLADLAALLGPDPAAADELRAAQRAGLVAVTAGSVRFTHPGVAVAVRAAAGPRERQQAHAALAAAPTIPSDRRLRHRVEAAAGPDEGLARELEEAAVRVLDGDGPTGSAAAVAALARSADLTPPGAPRVRRAARAAHAAAVVEGDLDAAAALPVGLSGEGDGPLWCAAARAHVLVHGDGDLDAAHRVLVAVLEQAATRRDAEPAALAAAVDTLLTTCRLADREALWAPLRALTARLGTRLPPGLAAPDGPPADDRPGPTAAVRAAWSRHAVDDVRRCAPALHRVARDGRRGGAVGPAVGAGVLLTLDAVAAGRWDEADRLAERAMAAAAAHGHETLAMLCRAGPALLAAGRGDEERCREHTDAMIVWAAPRGARLVLRYAVHAQVLAALGRGDVEEAHQLACPLDGPGAWRALALLDRVEAAVRTQRHDEAAAHVRAARATGAAGGSARAALAIACCAALVEHGERARVRYEEALAVPGAQAWPFDLARVRLSYGEHLRRSRATRVARLQLTSALTTFRALGAHPWTARAESELRATGAGAARARGTIATALSHQERTVARLAATGATNRQIGEHLGLSPRTVGSHLARVFQKLGVASRAALAEAPGVIDQD